MNAADALNTSPGNGKPLLLVVDDESGIREFLSAYLQSKDWKVLTASSGEDALRVWEDQGGEIDLLITDIVMPGINGKALAELLQAEKPSLKLIFMSGYLPEEIAEETLDGAFFKKPFHPSDLLEAVQEALH